MMTQLMPSTLFAALLAFGAAHAAPTDPVGYVSLGDTTFGQPAIKARTDVAVAIPLDRSATFAGTVASVTGNQITISGNINFTPNQFAVPGSPYVAKLEGGARSGLNALITSNGTKTLTVAIQPGDDLSGVVPGDAISIRSAWTVSRLMGMDMPIGTQLLAFSGNVAGINLAADKAYEFNGVDWEDIFTFENGNDAVLYTGEGLIVRNNTNIPIQFFIISGEVPTSASRVIVSKLGAGGQDNWVSYVSPVDEPLGSSGLSAIASVGDQVFAFNNNQAGLNKSASSIAEWNGSYWEDLFTSADVSTTFMLNGTRAYVIRRPASAPIGDKVWSDLPSYVFGL